MARHPCAQCGELTANTKYCTPGCMTAHRRGPARHCANCGAALKVKQKLTCSYRCSGAAAGDRPRASAATDARVRELWSVVPAIAQEHIGAMLTPPISKAAVHRIARRLELPKRLAPRPGRPAKPKTEFKAKYAAPMRAQRPVAGPVLRRNPTFGAAPLDKWRLNPRPARKPPGQVPGGEPVAERSYQHPPLGAWLLLACPAWCEECRRAQPMRCEVAA